MTFQRDDTATGYAALDLFDPDTAHRGAFRAALDRCVARTAEQIGWFGQRLPRVSAPGATAYRFCRPREWVAGFWPGQLWLAHAVTGEPRFANAARATRPYFRRFLDRHDWHNHDLGFLYALSTVADHRLTGDPEARALALRAAEALAARRRAPMAALTCWNPLPWDDADFARRKAGTVILDSVENMGLLLWAQAETGNPSFGRIVGAHLDACADHLVREDGSTAHCFEFDPATGAPVGAFTHQGLAADSCWARGQAWGIHGYAVAYLATGEARWRDVALRLAAHQAARMPDGGVPPWDYDAPEGAARDSSAGAITAAGLYALAQGCADDPDTARRLVAQADALLIALVRGCDLTGSAGAEGLLAQGTAFHGVGLTDVMLPYGDYFYVEALMRALGHTAFFWT